MRTLRKVPSFRHAASVALASAAVFSLVVACGGSSEGAKSPAENSENTASNASDATKGSNAADSENTGSETTTTLNVPDGGDLQGMKLETTTHKVVEVKGDGGAAPPPGPSSETGRKREDVQAVIQAHRDEARACYDKGVKEHPGIEGNLDVKWTVDPEGNVTNAEVDPSKSQILEPSVGNCVIDVIKKIKFNASSKGFETKMHYPFNFHPRGAQAKPAGK